MTNRIVVCSLGSIGRRHLYCLRRYWPSIATAVLRSGRGHVRNEDSLVEPQFTSISDAIAWKPDAAIIASPATVHLSQALAFARSNIPVLIEKPVGTGSELNSDWQELDAYASSGLPILVGYVLRYDQAFSWIQSQLANGWLGQLVEVDAQCGSWLPGWRVNTDYRNSVSARSELGGGVLLELSHELDLLLALLGPIRLQSSLLRRTGLLDIDVEDHAILAGIAHEGVPVTMRLNFCSQPSKRLICFRGSAGELNWDLVAGTVALKSASDSESAVQALGLSADERYRRQLEHFLDCCAGRAQPLCSLADGLAALDLVKAARVLHATTMPLI